jgi:hypothetical protein
MALHQAKPPKRLRKVPESYNGWSDTFTPSEGPVENSTEQIVQRQSESSTGISPLQPPTIPCGDPELATQFWGSVIKSDPCWLWIGQIHDGLVLSWRYHFGPIPKQLGVFQTCDEPRCVRPAHLHLGLAAVGTRANQPQLQQQRNQVVRGSR